MNPMDMMKAAKMWGDFQKRHPKIPMFFKTASGKGAFHTGTVLELTIKTPEGKCMTANMKIHSEDVELLEQIAGMKKKQ